MASTLQTIPMTDILMDEDFNCRGQIAPIDVVDLAKDIERQGLIQPITVCKLDPPKEGKHYWLLAGHRRFKAHIILKKETILCVLMDHAVDEVEARTINLAENLHRKDLNVLQQAKAIRPLFILGLTEEKIANKLGQSRGWVQIRAMLLKLPEPVQKEIEAGMISHTNIRELYAIHRAGNMDNLYKAVRDIKDKKIRGLKRVTVNPAFTKEKMTDGKIYRLQREIERMTIKLVEHKVKGLHTRALAWACGNLSTTDFMKSIDEWADDQGIDYVPLSKEELEEICVR